MSAICGILGLGDAPLPPAALERMMQTMQRHGPDSSGIWQEQRTGMGQQMMHTTPESLTEQLPFYDSESQSVITADARLDNREDLAAALGLPLSVGLSDSRLILHAFLKWGKDCADYLIGEFAFAIWDGRSRRMYCVTDPMGIRPLFYRELPGRYFAFASEVSALLALSDAPAPLHDRRLAMLGVSAMTTYLEPDTTLFETIFRVPAATVLSVDSGRKKFSEYWRPSRGKRLQFRSEAECGEAFREVFFKAVNARLRSAFPVSSLLSGGLDSSGIVCAAGTILARANKSLITLSSVPMPGASSEVVHERDYIEAFKDWPQLEMRYVSAPGRGPFDDLSELVQSASLCSYSFQHYLYTALVRAAKADGARVILDGHGGEHSATCTPEGFLAELLLTGRWRTLARELRCFDAQKRITAAAVRKQVLRPLLPYPLLRLLRRHVRPTQWAPYPLRSEFIQDVLGRDVDDIKWQIYRMRSPLAGHRRNMARDQWLERIDLRKRSHAGFIDYQEATFSYPYLDKRVLEFCLAVDGRLKYRNGYGRRLLKSSMADLLPSTIIERTSKAPFAPDYHLRYTSGKTRARDALQRFSDNQSLKAIVDIEKVLGTLEQPTSYYREAPMRMDYGPQVQVPFAVYLCYFLDCFAAGKGQTRVR